MLRVLLLCLSIITPAVLAECTKHQRAPLSDLNQYYRPALNLTGSELKHTLNGIVSGHTRYSYTPCVWDILKEADEDPINDRNVLGFYTGQSILKSDQDSGQNDPNSWNRENIWAKSHGFPNKSQHA